MVISGPNKFFQDIIYAIPKFCCHSEGTCCLIIVLLWGFTIWKKKNKDKKQKNPGPLALISLVFWTLYSCFSLSEIQMVVLVLSDPFQLKKFSEIYSPTIVKNNH